MGRVIIILILVGLNFIPHDWLMDGPYLLRALSYSFFHANWWHISINSIAILTIYKTIKPKDLVLSYLIAVLVYPLSFRPVIGFSNILYAQLGMRTPKLSSPWWKQPSVIVFIIVTIALVFIPRFSATTHIFSFLLGMGVSSFRRFKADLLRDTQRYL